MLQPAESSFHKASGREAKRALLLDEAAREFNARGISGASLVRIARNMRLTRAALYYYMKDRDDLAVQCYRRTCEVLEADLSAAAREPGGLARIRSFIRRSLSPSRNDVAVLSELDHLDGRSRSAIVAAHARNVDKLREFVRDGIADGSIRACDDEIVAQMLIGTVFWIPLSVDWVEGTDETYRERAIEALLDLIENGLAKDPNLEFESPIRIERFFVPPANVFDREATAEAKIERILMTASQSFNRRGIDGTSLEDITRALGATKGAFYHYLENKSELVVRCYRRAYALYERFADAATALGRNGLERGLIGLYLNTQAQAVGLAPLIQMIGATALPPAARREITGRARKLQRRFETFGKQGLADGSWREVDFDAVSQLGAGPFEWLPKWFRAEDPRAANILAQEVTRFFIRGLRRR